MPSSSASARAKPRRLAANSDLAVGPGLIAEDPRTVAMERQADALQQGAEARQAQADAWNRIADVLEKFVPAAETIHGFAGRLDTFCRWVKSGWPWLFGLAILIMIRLVAADPAKAPTVIAGFIDLLKAVL